MLEVKNLVKHFPVNGGKNRVVHAVEDVSFNIKEGETLGLVGESGCGKSTVARTIMRIYKPTSGKIILEGQDISSFNKKELKETRKKMQMIFQDPYSSLNARMKIRDIIAEPLLAHKIFNNTKDIDDAVYEVLSKVGLSKEHLNRFPHEFSGGQRQRIGIARALIINPKVIICDEPISALDVSIQAQIVNLLKDFQEEKNYSYLFIAHDLSMVRYVSHRVGVMYLGKLVEICESEEIYKKPLHPYTIGLLNSVPVPYSKKERKPLEVSIEGDIPSPISLPNGCAFHTRCKHKMEVCKCEIPKMKEVDNGHFVACHLYNN